MEALQLKVDNLRWEVKRLDAENQKLRDQYPEKAKRVDAEIELEQAQGDINQLTKELKSYEAQLVELKQTLEVTEKRATEAETRAAKAEEHALKAREQATDAQQRADALQREAQELKETHASLDEELGETKHGVEQERVRSQELAVQVKDRENELLLLKESLARAEVTLDERCSQHVVEMEAICKEASLDRYRALEAEQAKWEAREKRLIDQLEAAKHDYRSGASDSVDLLTTKLKEAERQQNQLIVQLSEAKMQCSQLAEAKKSQDQQMEEFKAEIVFLKTKLRGVELGGGLTRDPTLSRPPPSTCPMTPSVTLTPPRISWAGTGVSTTVSTLSSSATVPSTCTIAGVSTPALDSTVTTLTTASTSALVSVPPPTVSGVSTPSGVSAIVTSGASVSLRPPTLTLPSTNPMVPGSSFLSAPSVSSSTATAAAPHVPVPPYVFPAAYLASSTAHMNQMPQFRCFNGEESGDGDLFQDWLEQFESVALLGGWGEHGKLVNLTTRLRGAAYSFYRSCTKEEVHSSSTNSNSNPDVP